MSFNDNDNNNDIKMDDINMDFNNTNINMNNNANLLEYYLECKNHYNAIERNLDVIMYHYYCLKEKDYGAYVANVKEDSFIQWNVFKEHKKDVLNNKKICNAKINELCHHVYDTDTIDIDPDKSCTIVFCTICGNTK
jgi:hypothetical protein